jgi:hypothetical protein
MLPFIVGSIMALAFALLSSMVYGPESLTEYPWVMLVLWGLLAGSGMMSLASAGDAGPSSLRPGS